MREGLQPDPSFQARVLAGRGLAEAGDFAAAEAHFRDLLEASRDTHAGNHARAIQSLITLFGRGGRYLEAHLLARRLAERARAVGPEADDVLAFALGAICGALSQLDLLEPLGAALRDLRAVLDRAPVPYVNLELEYHAAASARARELGEFADAREHMLLYRRLLDAHPEAEAVFRWALLMGQAQLAHAEGQHDLALQLLEALGTGDRSPPFHRLKELALAVGVHTARQETDAAHALAEEALTVLAATHEQPGLASGRIHEGAVLARDLESLGAFALAGSVYDLVAAAVLVRLRQVEACTRELPELGLDDAETNAVLARFRRQFVQEQRQLLHRVAALLETRGDAEVEALLADSAPEGYVAICAWCESVRPSDGRWLPLGHFIPRESSVHVTHGICPPCADGLGT